MKISFAILLTLFAQAMISMLTAAVGTNVFDPGVPLGTNEMNVIRAAASNSLSGFKAGIKPANRQLMGFDSDAQVAAATNGEPMMAFTIRRAQLTNYHVGVDVSTLFMPTSLMQGKLKAFIPISVGTNVLSGMILRRTAAASATAPTGTSGGTGVWGGIDWGHPILIRNLVATWRAIPDADLAVGTIKFVVEVPTPRIWLIGYYDAQQELVLRSTMNVQVGTATIHRHEILTQLQMEQLAAEARRFNPALPN
jgi:hypothetical protein